MKISMTDYWMGRDVIFPLAMTSEIEQEGRRTVDLANQLIERASMFGVILTQTNPRTGTFVSSGWRPPSINASTPNAATNSKHMTGCAIDIYDPDGDLDDWLMNEKGQATLASLGLWMEHPAATKGWCHVQTVPPNSNRRVYYP
jgi:hypothetical protein